MSHRYRKIEYETMGPYGSTDTRTLYVHYNNTSDYVTVYDDSGKVVLSFDEWGFDMGLALIKLLTNYDEHEEVKKLDPEEWEKLKEWGVR